MLGVPAVWTETTKRTLFGGRCRGSVGPKIGSDSDRVDTGCGGGTGSRLGRE